MNIVHRPFIRTSGRFGTARFTPLAWPILLIGAACIGFGIGVLLQVVPAIGQIAALGTRGAWLRYHASWRFFSLAAAAVTVVALIAAVIIDRVYIWIHATSRFRYSGAVKVLLFLVIFGGVVWLSAYGAYLDALRANPSADSASLISSVKSSVADVLHNLEGETTAASTTGAEIQKLEKQRQEAELKLVRLRALLSGVEPVTKRDFEAAQRSAWWQGIILGVVTSVAGSFIFRWLTRPRTEAEQS